MSSFATVKCPKCGKEKKLHLGGLGFYGQEQTRCKFCGHVFDNIKNCIMEESDD